ncbi:MAG: ribosomal protein S18-alanine N-acetyltransferase [Deltaproteobacteria bacterium]|nr:ribosomal protein S18-alanine N-acetyltransferase [Kofleriaceae bacterium]
MRAVHPGAVVIAPATAADLDAIDEISRHSFKTPWSRQTFEDELGRAQARLEVARRGADVVGYVNYWLVADEVHLLAIATHPDARRGGVGEALLRHLIDGARGRDARLVTLEVRAGNEAAVGLYHRFGFVDVAMRRGYYGDDDEDAIVMLLELRSPGPGAPAW